MNKNAILRKVNKYPEGAKIAKLFPAIAGGRLAECKNVDADCLRKLNLSGNNEELTLQFLIDSYVIATKEGNSVLTEDGAFLGRMMGGSFVVSENALDVFSINEEDIEVEVYKQDGGTSEEPNDVQGDAEEVEEEPEKKEAKVKEKSNKDSEDETKIMNYYAAYYNGVVMELLKRYSSMYSSGYQLKRPAGILTEEGLVKVSGSERVVGENTVSTYNIYKIISSYVSFIENPNRSIKYIANDLYDGYSQGGQIIYFPNKMLEFAYGLEAPTTDGANSIKTYSKHSNANSWSRYVSTELESALRRLVGKITYGFVVMEMRNKSIEDYRDKSIGESLKGYLDYVKSCLSFCILVPEYKVVKSNNGPEVTSFKVRVCDPTQRLLGMDITPQIIQESFMGSPGRDAFSYKPNVNVEHCVVEYSHEFNHSMSQATPLFAYKALESIKNNGEDLSWERMVLGMGEDGSIVRSIPADSTENGIKLCVHLTHNISAGSRAGKGVMTLNILASGIASRKNIFYLDRKPDMASLFKYMSPSMFVLNGADYKEKYDMYKTWSPDITKSIIGNVPDEVLEAFNVTPTWANLGDLYYMRALKLVIGILLLRDVISVVSEDLGGEDGILLIVDEFTNFQASYMSLISKLTSYIPNIKIDEARTKLQEGKISQAVFDRAYNNRNYYALSYMLCALKDVSYIDFMKKAGQNPLEVSKSDIFVIGQDLKYGEFNYNDFKDSFENNSSSARKKSSDAFGLNASGFIVGTQSIPYNVVNCKTADAFFGRNDQGYLAANSPSSKAHGKLDDKAGNFAYMSSFSETTREEMVANKGSDNLNYAEQCKYFKPFLILNSSGLEDQCVEQMFQRVENNAGISRVELIQDNPSYNDPSRINEAIGFIDYIKMAGCDNVSNVLAKSSKIANYVVKDILKYPGDWLQFVTDLSPEWLFTVEDVVLAGTEGDCPLWHPDTNPVLKEYYDFNPERFSGSFVESSVKSERAMDEFLFDDSEKEDFSNEKIMAEEESDRLKGVFDELGNQFDEDEEIDIFGEPEELSESEVNNTKAEDLNKSVRSGEFESNVREAEALINRLKELGVNVFINTGTAESNTEPEVAEPQRVNNRASISFDDVEVIDDSMETYEMLVSKVTKNILDMFGGLSRVRTFEVKGGSIAVNGTFYRCKVSASNSCSIPYDVRMQINSGNIQSLFDYRLLFEMPNLRSISIDSVDLALDYIYPLVKGDNVVKGLFNSIKSLQTLKVGKEVTTRTDANKDAVEKKLKDAERRRHIGDTIQGACFKGASKSWAFNGKVIRSNKKWYVKMVGLTLGTTATLVSGAAGVTTATSRKVGQKVGQFGKNLIGGVKDLLNS